ncbi:hypothetical protein SAMN05421823_110108 [Catalinimonas alkaloidigena]|uniref:DUF4468 domain-containing protein n=1 Tax=Catalinimonas alkaloidigena TaxID=1075417 RepID=A0A1G9QBC5_9BACT|nr:hypothetical protein [Catalinimonas alkaloidigena]SDM08269.1 hypothetical protein SAMN05421823_110108 [Catalinimonas alkaloidigena]
MLKTTALVGSLFLAVPCLGQLHAVTGTGEEVLLYEDGTWAYVDGEVDSTATIPLNATPFVKAKDATFLVKSDRVDIRVYINPKQWSFGKAQSNDAAEFQFKLKDEDAYAMFISERLEVPLESFKEIALTNGRNAAPDIRVVKEEYRMVNGRKVLCLQMKGTVQGMKVIYYGYYYSFAGGTVQLITYTAQNMLQRYESSMEKLLNGLVAL